MLSYWLILAHVFGDYILQNDWMANGKTKRRVPCAAHAASYTLPFVLLTQAWQPLLFIGVTHFIIDHWRLAKYVNFGKQFLSPRHQLGGSPPEGAEPLGGHHGQVQTPFGKQTTVVFRHPDGTLKPYIYTATEPAGWGGFQEYIPIWPAWAECSNTGYRDDRPAWMTVWLFIIGDNALHLLCNGAAFAWWAI